MFDEREFITRVEAAGPRDFADLIRSPKAEEERALRVHFGDSQFEELQQLAFATSLRAQVQGNVVVLHGILGSELAVGSTRIWLDIFRLIAGRFSRLALDGNGQSEADIKPFGLLKRYYGKQLLKLGQRWRVRGFAYDWRLDIFESAKRLASDIDSWFEPGEPVHLVAHSMGGLVARAFIARYPERWRTMWDSPGEGRRGGRLVMLGTPNHGSFAIPQLLLGMNGTIRKLALLDVANDLNALLTTVRSFAGTYQMLPSALLDEAYGSFLNTPTLGVPSQFVGRLQLARETQRELATIADPERMFYIAGCDRATVTGISDWSNLRQTSAFEITRDGDGTVPHRFGLLKSDSGPVRTFYVEEEHGKLPGNDAVILATEALFEGRVNDTGLLDAPVRQRGGDPRSEWELRQQQEAVEVDMLSAQLKVRRARSEPPPALSPQEHSIEAIIMSEFAGATANTEPADAVVSAGTKTSPTKPGSTPQPVPSLKIRVWRGGIEKAGTDANSQEADAPVDAISVGHYMGVRPIAAEEALDKAISAELVAAGEAAGVITQLSDRKILRGELGQPFFLPDPRPGDVPRVIAIAGMGLPGRFGISELKVLARELAWSLGRLRKQHLASVLIGSGAGNLEIEEAVEGWLAGLRRALLEAEGVDSPRLTTVTFVEFSAARAVRIYDALEEQKKQLKKKLAIDLAPLASEKDLRAEAHAEKTRPTARVENTEPTRVTVELPGDTYVYGALTEHAAVPQRVVPLNPVVIREGIERLIAAETPDDQLELGEYMQRLLIPADFRAALAGDAPLVMVCDNRTAQVPWEMLTQPASESLLDAHEAPQERYLGLRRTLTRQLRTTFAPPPEPPPPAKRTLRVLIVADPSADEPLPGAREEGWALSELLGLYRDKHSPETGNTVEWLPLIGPGRATMTEVLKELLLHQYDVLHFAGHCFFDPKQPGRSGWIFSSRLVEGQKQEQILTANELNRIDRVPRLIVTNACESGVLPERAELQSPALGPAFAEAFFARGVADFVCTAWPVNDASAVEFTKKLYRQLLGIGGPPDSICGAMRAARLEVQKHSQGGRSWGAYQHYGNPNFRFFR